jgi:hypothetical protein
MIELFKKRDAEEAIFDQKKDQMILYVSIATANEIFNKWIEKKQKSLNEDKLSELHTLYDDYGKMVDL